LETAKHVSETLGNMTITSRGAGESMGKSRSTSYNYSQQKRELMTPNELQQLPNDEQVVMVRAICPLRVHKFKLEEHPNFKQSADFDQSKRLSIQDWFNLEEKIERLNAKKGIEDKREKQEDINQRAQQPVDDWMNKRLGGEKVVATNGKEDEFFF
jgi:type IV secretory pathway TraG/TraD family ATPase VirD4